MQRILKILGKRGRITIPWELRRAMGFAHGDVVSFARSGDAVLVRREKLCDNCKADTCATFLAGRTAAPGTRPEDVTAEELRAEIVRLSARWAEMRSGGGADA